MGKLRLLNGCTGNGGGSGPPLSANITCEFEYFLLHLFEIDVIMKAKIIELKSKGLSNVEIVKELGCAKSTVSYHVNREGLGKR